MDTGFLSIEKTQPPVQIAQADVGVASFGIRGNAVDVRNRLKTDTIVQNIDFQLLLLTDDVDSQFSASFLRFQTVDEGILHQGLDAETGDDAAVEIRGNLDVHGYLILKTHLLEVGVQAYILQLLP